MNRLINEKVSSSSEKSSPIGNDKKVYTNTNHLEDHSLDKEEQELSQSEEEERGVSKIDAVRNFMNNTKGGYKYKIVFCLSILICAWAYSLDSSTTYNYSIYATSSFERHSMITTLGIATSIISAVSKPFIAKISDITSRPITYIVALFFYTIGTIIVASSSSISAYIVGEAFGAIGSSGLDLLNDIIVGDLTPLKWRGLISSFLSFPFIINVWYSGYIVQDLVPDQWRWGYGMFAIIMPVVLTPAIVTMLFLQKKAQKSGQIKKFIGNDTQTVWESLKANLIIIDAFGLIILGFGWALLLLPFSLYKYANGGWYNPSMLVMIILGGLFLIFYVVYEFKWSKFPSMPRRVFNRTFLCAVVLDFFAQFVSSLRATYLSTYVLVTKNWAIRDWTYYNNSLTLTLCVFGIVAGIIQRITHRYKYLQVSGLAIKMIGLGLLIAPMGEVPNTARLVFANILVGSGGAFSVVGSRVASQASVPHQDMALAISILSLWSSIGSAIGSAVCAPIWLTKLPMYLNQYVPDLADEIFLSAATTTSLPEYEAEKDNISKAFSSTMFCILIPALAISIIPLIASFFQTNFHLDDRQNACEEKIESQSINEVEEDTAPKNWKDRLAHFYSQPLSGVKRQ